MKLHFLDLEVISELKVLKGVILTMNNEDSFIKKAKGNGVDGYLLKKADWEESYNAFYSVRKIQQQRLPPYFDHPQNRYFD